ncbi:hypothetical protein IL306_008664 [Fusarium sp. DS 682]|nr:hypothetical protein IL306_008664 [Fusarium sp. DS 682]
MSTSEAALATSFWRHCLLSLPSIDALYNYEERITPPTFQPDKNLTVFRIFIPDDSQEPHLQPLKDYHISNGSYLKMTFEGAQRSLKHDPRIDIWGLRLNDHGGASFKWDTKKSLIHDLIQRQWDFVKELPNPNFYPTGVEPLWVLRSFFIGPDTSHSPPYITVLCSHEKLSRRLVEIIRDELRRPSWRSLRDWGVTRLPNASPLRLGSPPGSPSSNVQEPSENNEDSTENQEWDASSQRIEVRLTEGGLPITIPDPGTRSLWDNQQPKCGIRLDVIRDSGVHTQATIGGLIEVGGAVYGLTVSHIFLVSDLPSGEQQHPTMNTSDESSGASTDENETGSGRWNSSLRQSMIFDWGLVEIPSLRARQQRPEPWANVNLVQSMSGDFRPVLVASEMPLNGTPVVLATPGSVLCLQGILTCEEALVNVPESPNPYVTWVLRMEQPWLIRPGDSGSWAFDAGSGDLLGILVAGCPELHEAYIIPAHQGFGHIRRVLGQDVKIPNSYPSPESVGKRISRPQERVQHMATARSQFKRH